MTKKKRSLPTILTLRHSKLGVTIALLFAALSFTPSLLPRSWMLQAVLTGLSISVGYGLGNGLGTLYRAFELPQPSQNLHKKFNKFIPIIGSVLFLIFAVRSVDWNNNLQRLVGQEETTTFSLLPILFVASLVVLITIIIARVFRKAVAWVISQVDRALPKRAANLVGLVTGSLLIIFILNGILVNFVMSGVNQAFSLRDGTTDEGVVQPQVNEKSGSEDSAVPWDSLGRQGRKFIGLGPGAESINEISGGDAKEPIRVYVGLKSADSLEERAQLALDELIRTGAFNRNLLVVATTTGTGWLDPGAVDTIEYIHNGDTAIVGLQYSYLPSWISLFVDQQTTIDTSRATLEIVHDYWSNLPEDSRPELYLFGLSLGAYGSQESATSLRLVNDPIDGALWAGSPFVSDIWSQLTNNRDEGSPAWLPIVDEGRVVRFTGEENTLQEPAAQWGDVKYAYLQHATDPIVFFSPGLVVNSPDWLIEGERGPDVSSDMDWYPFVTFWQVAADLPMAGAVPPGHGHAYSPSSYVDTWVEVTEPADWSDAKTESLEKLFLE